MGSNFEILLEKIDGFIRRYYLNLLIKGSLLFGAGFLLLFLGFAILENFGYFTSPIRFVIFYAFLAFNAYVLIRYVIIPFLGLLRIGRKIDAKEAGRILAVHFRQELNDKVINTLQLKEFLDTHPQNAELIMAGINQKAGLASKIPFNNAINLRGNLRYLPFLIIPVLVIAAFLIVRPALLLEPANRIVRYQTHFEKPAPFDIILLSDLKGFRNQNLEILVKAEGSIAPLQARIVMGNGKFLMDSKEKGRFSYLVRNLQDSFQFFIDAEGFVFGPYAVDVTQKPAISHFNVKIDFPAYTRIPSEQYLNIGDLSVAEGAVIQWTFNTRGTGNIEFIAGNEKITINQESEGIFSSKYIARESFRYHVYAWNEASGRGDSLSYFVQVRPDNYPRIEVEQFQDSVMLAHIFHRGLIQDDYGFERLEYHYRIIDSNSGSDAGEYPFLNENIDIETGVNNQNFFHHFDLRSVYMQPGESLEYFFQVYDNDGINGPKASRSRLFSYAIPSREELLARTRQSEELIKEELSGGIGEVRNARDEIENLRRQMLESDRISWDQQESIRELLDKQREIEKNLEKLSNEKRDSETRSDQFKETDERIKEKQEELQRIFDEVLSDELKDLFEKIREELEKLNRDQVYEMLSRMEFEFRDLETQMDRALELFRQLEMERMLQDGIEMLEQLKEEQGRISEQEISENQLDEMANQQENLNNRFDKLEDMLEDFREKNQELSRPLEIDDTHELEESISKEMKNAADELNDRKPDAARQNQKGAKQGMEELSERLKGMQQNMFMEQMAEDARALRQILENLLKSSFSQEELLLEIRNVNVSDPRYVAFIQEQRKIRDDLRMIEDSLIALGKRQIQIQSVVTREIGEINMNLEQAIYHLLERQRAQGAGRQQFVMTHINNLALLLNESLQNMQMQMAGAGGEGMPQPSQGEPSFQNMRQMQEQLNQMLQQMQQGNQPMPGKSGETPMSVSEAMARMAAEQEAIRNELQRMANQMRNDGMGENQELLELQKDMEQTELDMVRKQIGRQTMLRQEKILTRLLEHEKAELQREMEERRVGNTAKNWEISNPDAIFEYNRIRNRELEMLRSLPPEMKPFYRSLVETYFLNVQE